MFVSWIRELSICMCVCVYVFHFPLQFNVYDGKYNIISKCFLCAAGAWVLIISYFVFKCCGAATELLFMPLPLMIWKIIIAHIYYFSFSFFFFFVLFASWCSFQININFHLINSNQKLHTQSTTTYWWCIKEKDRVPTYELIAIKLQYVFSGIKVMVT